MLVEEEEIEMACFLVPGAEAIVTTIVTKVIENREKKEDAKNLEQGIILSDSECKKNHFSVKLKKLNGLLWGGSALLAFEHLWRGEIQPVFPFLTAAGSPADTAEMLREMSTVGVAMAAMVTCVWGVIIYAMHKMETVGDSAENVSVTEEAGQ